MAEDEVLAPATDNPAGQETVTPVETPAKDGGTGTVLDAPDKMVQPDWPEDWRDKLAGGDEKERARLDRFKSPTDVWKSTRELEKRMSSAKQALPADANDEQIASYRKENGIPDKPDGYLEKLPSGLVIGEDDKPMLESYLQRVHGKNASPEVVSETLEWYYAHQEQVMQDTIKADKELSNAAADELRAEWGSEYRANLQSMESFIKTAPVIGDRDIGKLLMNGRLADGTPILADAGAIRWFAELAHKENPAGFVSPGAGGSQLDSVETEIAKIEGVMRSDRGAYDRDEKMQARLRTLYEAQDRIKR